MADELQPTEAWWTQSCGLSASTFLPSSPSSQERSGEACWEPQPDEPNLSLERRWRPRWLALLFKRRWMRSQADANACVQVRLIFWFQSKRGFIFRCWFYATELKSWIGWGGSGKQKDPPCLTTKVAIWTSGPPTGFLETLPPPPLNHHHHSLRGLVSFTGIKSSDSKILVGVTVQTWRSCLIFAPFSLLLTDRIYIK